MIDRSLFTPDGTNPPCAVPIDDLCTVPTPEMAYLLADLVCGQRDASKLDLLEIGSGSGYQAAVLAERCRSLVSVDIKRQKGIEERLPANVALVLADGYEFETHEEFDGILVTFSARSIAPSWANQMKDGALLVVPIDTGNGCRISVYQRDGSRIRLRDVAGYAGFTPGAEA